MKLFHINNVIYFYMFICVALLLFNVFYIIYSKQKTHRGGKLEKKWLERLLPVWERVLKEGSVPAEHRKLVERKLRNVDQMIAYHETVKSHLTEPGVQQYLDLSHDVFQNLVLYYSGRPPMEKAYFAHVISVYHPDRGREHDRLEEILLSYMSDTTVYCRENVLQALYAMGNIAAIEHALSLLSDMEIYHHPRLLSDGMMKFSGDKKVLVRKLWAQRHRFSEPIQVAVVQFAAMISDEFSREFLKELEDERALMEVRFSLIRYFGRYPFEDALPFLLKCVREKKGDGVGFAVAACAVLAKYPGKETMEVLLDALHSRDWYVRRNAASSLIKLGISKQEEERLKNSGDQYAVEMLDYMKGELV
nr:HEAT repeat domain-containing protein [uncultured Blautia sp.]